MCFIVGVEDESTQTQRLVQCYKGCCTTYYSWMQCFIVWIAVTRLFGGEILRLKWYHTQKIKRETREGKEGKIGSSFSHSAGVFFSRRSTHFPLFQTKESSLRLLFATTEKGVAATTQTRTFPWKIFFRTLANKVSFCIWSTLKHSMQFGSGLFGGGLRE